MEAESELLSLPSVAMDAVLAFCSYDEISGLRLVCKKMNVICQRVLNQGFLRVERYHAQCQKQVKSQLPRRESERRSHPLARHADILAAVETRLSLLTMTFMKYVDMNLCCFIPGRVIDEIYRVLRYVNGTRTPQRAHEVLQELRDISSMAMEYFDEKIVPGLKKKIGGDMSTRFLSATSVPGPSGALATVQLFSKQSCSKQELNKMQTQLKANSTGLGGLRKELSDLRSKELSELRSKLGELQRQVQEQEQKLLEQSQVMVEQSTRLLEQERKLGQTEAKLTEQHSVQLALPPPPALQPSKGGGGGTPSTSTAADAGLAAGVGGRAAGQSARRRGGRGRGRGGGRGGGGGAGGVDRDDGSQPAPPAADRSRSRPGAVAAQGGSAGGSGGRRGSSGSHRKRCLAREAASSSANSASISGDGGCGAANCAAATTTVSVAATAGSASPSATGQALPKRRKMLHGDEEAVGGAARRTTRKAQGATAAVDSNSSKRQRAKK